MLSTHTLLVCVLVPVGLFAPAHALDFCPRAEDDCQSQVTTVVHTPVESSSDELAVSNLIQDITQLNVSCKNLIGKLIPIKGYEKETYITWVLIILYFFSAEKLPVDEVNGNFVRTVKNCIFSKSIPTPLRGPLRLAALSKVGSWQ